MAAMLIPGVAASALCNDEFIIAGVRNIPLMPGGSFFAYLQRDQLLIDRNGFYFRFVAEPSVEPGVHKYSIVLAGEKYFFQIRQDAQLNWRWSQYSDEVFSRGFGGGCELSSHEALWMSPSER